MFLVCCTIIIIIIFFSLAARSRALYATLRCCCCLLLTEGLHNKINTRQYKIRSSESQGVCFVILLVPWPFLVSRALLKRKAALEHGAEHGLAGTLCSASP